MGGIVLASYVRFSCSTSELSPHGADEQMDVEEDGERSKAALPPHFVVDVRFSADKDLVGYARLGKEAAAADALPGRVAIFQSLSCLLCFFAATLEGIDS